MMLLAGWAAAKPGANNRSWHLRATPHRALSFVCVGAIDSPTHGVYLRKNTLHEIDERVGK
jgi:hypothetical protein